MSDKEEMLFMEYNIISMLLEDALSKEEASIIFKGRYFKSNIEYVERLRDKFRDLHVYFEKERK